MGETNIEWASHSLNFYTWDCNRVSPGCKHCYMMELATRYGKPLVGRPQWRENAVKELKRMKSGSVIFVNSMSDTYHENVPVKYIHWIHNFAVSRPDLTFLLLTKRIERAYYLSPYLAWPENLWIGTSVESADYLWRLDYLTRVPAAGRFVSVEPLLGSLMDGHLHQFQWYLKHAKYPVNWTIVGGESGKDRRPFNKQWAAEIRDMCVEADVPFLFKQGSAHKPGQDRLLDGREWNQTPFRLEKHHGNISAI